MRDRRCGRSPPPFRRDETPAMLRPWCPSLRFQVDCARAKAVQHYTSADRGGREAARDSDDLVERSWLAGGRNPGFERGVYPRGRRLLACRQRREEPAPGLRGGCGWT